MRDMIRLAMIIADDNPERLRTALVTATAHVALGGSASLFLQGSAVALLRSPIADPDAGRQTAAGLPTLGQLFLEALGLDVHFSACQSSLALLDLTTDMFDSRVEWTGMIGFLSTIEPNDRLIMI